MGKMIPVILGIFLINASAYPALSGEWTTHGFIYKPSSGSRGETEKKKFDSGLDRVDERLRKEIWVGDPNSGTTIQDALNTIGTNQNILRVPAGVYNIGSNLTVPRNVTLWLERGASLNITSGATLTINSELDAGLYQIFTWSGSGTVVFDGPITKVYPHWFGAKGDGSTDDAASIQKAIDCANPGMSVVLPVTSSYYKILNTLTIGKGIAFYGEGVNNLYAIPTRSGARIRNMNTSGADAILVNDSVGSNLGYVLKDFSLDGNPLSGYGLRINSQQGSTFENIVVGRGLYSGSYAYGHGKSGVFVEDLSYYNTFNRVKVYSSQENGFLLKGLADQGINANTFNQCLTQNNKLNGYLVDSYCSANSFYSCEAESNGGYGFVVGATTASNGINNTSLYDFYNESNGLITGNDGVVVNAGLVSRIIGSGYFTGSIWINGGVHAKVDSVHATNIAIGCDAAYTQIQNMWYTATLTDNGRYTTVVDSVMGGKGIYSSGYGAETAFKVGQYGLELGTGNAYSFMPIKWYGMQIFPWHNLGVGDLLNPKPPYNIQRGDRAFLKTATAGAPAEAVCVQRLDTTIRVQANAGDSTIEVADTTGLAADDYVGILLDNGSWHDVLVNSVVDGDTITTKWATIPAGRHAAVGAAVRTCRWKTGAALAN